MSDVMFLAISDKDINEFSGRRFKAKRIGCNLT